MAAKIVHVELPASDPARATEFYSQLLGVQFHDSGMPGIDYKLYEGEPGGAVYQSEHAGRGPTIYFGTDDIDAAVARVRGLGAEADDKGFSFFQSDESVPPPPQ